MKESSKQTIDRASLGFADIAEKQFEFLKDLGFSLFETSPTIVKFKMDEIEARVYHGRQSYEVGFEICRGKKCHSIGALIRIVDTAAGDHYRNPAATTRDGLSKILGDVAALVKHYCLPALRDDPECFVKLEAQAIELAGILGLDVLESQLRPKAEEAFRQRDYSKAAELYRKILQRLSPTEIKKLDFAEKHRQ